MTIYAYSPTTGELIRTDNVADWMGTTEVPPPDFDPVAASCFWRDDHWEVVEAQQEAPVPQSLTRAQAIGALILAGLDEQVQPAIDSIEDPMQRKLAQNDWDNRQTFERGHPTLVALAAALGLSDEQLDQLFIVGAGL